MNYPVYFKVEKVTDEKLKEKDAKKGGGAGDAQREIYSFK